MLNIYIPGETLFDEKTGEFIEVKGRTLQLEHSLLALKKWESKWHKGFLKKDEKTDEELLDYIRCMTITPNVDPMLYRVIKPEETKKIVDYIQDPMTATKAKQTPNTPIKRNDIPTAEIFYYWMITLNVPVEFQKWHLNQLITLINVIGEKNSRDSNGKPRKLTSAEQQAAIARRDAENMRRRALYNTKG